MAATILDYKTYDKNSLFVYEIDIDDRKKMKTYHEHQKKLFDTISCSTNKTFIENYNHYHNILCKNINVDDDGVITGMNTYNPKIKLGEACDFLPLEHSKINGYPSLLMKPNQILNYKNNIKFVKELDNVINSKTFATNQYEIKKRSTHLFKGFKNFIIDDSLKDINGKIKTEVNPIIGPGFYDSTSTNIYKGCLYAHQYPYVKINKSKEVIKKDLGHLFIITPREDAHCIDYIQACKSNSNTSGTGTKYTDENIEPIQYDTKHKYIFEQEVLFKRYSVFKNIRYIGQIKSICDKEICNDTDDEYHLTLNKHGELFKTNSGQLIAQTHKIDLITEELDLSTHKIDVDLNNFKYKSNLDIFDDNKCKTPIPEEKNSFVNLKKLGYLDDHLDLNTFIDTYVYTCDLHDAPDPDDEVHLVKKDINNEKELEEYNNNIQFEMILFKESQARLKTSDFDSFDSNTIYIFSVEKIAINNRFGFARTNESKDIEVIFKQNHAVSGNYLHDNCQLFQNSSEFGLELPTNIFILCINYSDTAINKNTIINDIKSLYEEIKKIYSKNPKRFILFYNDNDNDNDNNIKYINEASFEISHASEKLYNNKVTKTSFFLQYTNDYKQEGGNYNSKYYAKYLKYKIKYLELKSNL